MIEIKTSPVYYVVLSFLLLPSLVFSNCPVADLSGDCIVDISDLVVFANDWLSSEVPLNPNLVALWRLDQNPGEQVATEDINGYDGQLVGDPEWLPAEGYRQGALFFDGQDDYVKVDDICDTIANHDFTVSMWMKSGTKNAQQFLCAFNGATGENRLLFGRDGSADDIIGIHDNGWHKSDIQAFDGTWHHVAFVLSTTQELCAIFVDGTSRYAYATSTSIDAQDLMSLGQEYDPGLVEGDFYEGKMDDVRIYNRALTTNEIYRLFTTGSALRDNPDFSGDYVVNIEDSAIFSKEWNTQSPQVIISEFLADNDSDDPPVAEEGQILDGDGDASDWIEIYNQTDFPIDLSGWGLSDDVQDLLQWEFPAGTVIDSQNYLLVFASGQDEEDYPYIDALGYMHTSFKLSASGEFLSLTRPDGTVECVFSSVSGGYPEQEENISYGILNNSEYYFARPTPNSDNYTSFLGFVDTPDFSHERGFYSAPFNLTLTSETEDAVIRYTIDGTEPTLSNGTTYTSPVSITTTSLCVRAAAFKPGYRSSRIKTKTYLLNASDLIKGLPVLSLSGSPTQTFFKPYGIMAIVGGYWDSSGVWRKNVSSDYNNVLGHGMDYERPASMEYFNSSLGANYQEDCGIRVHGSAWMRPRYTQPSGGVWSGFNKYSLRLYFRTLYGDSLLRHPILEQFPEVDKMDAVVLRAGHNDQSNPFVRDEMIRRLHYYMGHYGSLGTFVNLCINGSYKGYYNLCERIDEDFCQKYYDSNRDWDVVGWIQPTNILEARDGDMVAFKDYINYAHNNDLSNPDYYNEVVSQLDLEGFIDYVIVQCWGGNWDWPQNNWTAAAERSENRKWRFYVWDAEGCMDGDLYRNRFGELNSTSSTDLSKLYSSLRSNEDFRLLFADRLQKHFFDPEGVMRKEFMTSLFWQLAEEVQGVIPNIYTYIPNTYIPGRESVFFDQCQSQGLFTYKAPRIYLDGKELFNDEYALDSDLLLFANAPGVSGSVYFTLDGSDPRNPVSHRESMETLVAEDAPKRVLIPTGNVNPTWRSNIEYNDSEWNAGLPVDSSKTGGVGYEKSLPGNTAYISYDVDDEMYDQYTTAYIRIPFTVDASAMNDWNYLKLKIRYDDGFVAYINGTEVCRRGFSGTPAWDSDASSSHENDGLVEIDISSYLGQLQAGENLLAIHGLNVNDDSSDFIISPILEAGYSLGEIALSAVRYVSPVTLQKSAHVKARTLNGSTWSALREMDIVVGHVNETLRISEFMYHPASDPNEEFIELTNAGSDPINLNYVSFTDGLDYTFGDWVLDPDEFVIVVRNQAVFESKYGTGLPIAGQYEGSLKNAGEKIKLSDAAGNKIQTVNFEDNWHEITDGDGFSMNVIDPAYEQTAVLVPDPQARWTFDESTGVNVFDSVGDHHGIILNMADTTRVQGHVYKALAFDGIDDYVKVDDFSQAIANSDFTVSMWMKAGNKNEQQFLCAFNTITGENRLLLGRDGSDNIIGIFDDEWHKSGVPAFNGMWHHIAFVLSTTQGLCTLFVDGISGNTYTTSTSIDIQDLMSFGQEYDPGMVEGDFYEGMMDDIRIYDRALKSEEIALLADGISWSQKDLWRPSAIRGGTPGRAETVQERVPLPGAIAINEILSHSHSTLPDWIELYNTTGQDIEIGGWFLSDSYGLDVDRKKYQIPAGVVLTAFNPYYVIEEGRFNNLSDSGCRIPFALSEGGETLYLQSADGEDLTGYFIKEEFGAAATNISFGRHQKSTGTWNFVPMSVQTKEAANAYPQVGPIIISEIMYNPGSGDDDQDYEYIELMNITGQSVRTAGFVSTYSSPTEYVEEWIPWRFTDGIAYEFPVDMEFAAGQRVLLVKDVDAFNSTYPNVPGGTVILQWADGSLDNGGEKLQLSMPGDLEYEQDRYYIRVDRVVYDDETPWSPQADGTGQSLTHIRPTEAMNNYTNDPVNWNAAAQTPGQ